MAAVFGLFTNMGGPVAALATLVGGLVIYLVATFTGYAYPYLLSLAASLLTYVVVAVLERTASRMRHA